MSRVVHFELGADDLKRAAEFYGNVFGWEIQKWEGPVEYWLVTTGPEDRSGINGGLINRRFQNAVNTIEVDSLDATIGKIVDSGGEVVQPKSAVPGVGYMAYCRDTEGNIFGLMQPDQKAK
jgi:predicted enzyme related to lactoylglutathione lyase